MRSRLEETLDFQRSGFVAPASSVVEEVATGVFFVLLQFAVLGSTVNQNQSQHRSNLSVLKERCYDAFANSVGLLASLCSFLVPGSQQSFDPQDRFIIHVDRLHESKSRMFRSQCQSRPCFD